MGSAGFELVEDRRGAVMVALVVSVLLHGVIAVLLAVLAGLPSDGGAMTSPARMNREMVRPMEDEDELKLGMNEATAASITWLGIQRPEPVEGEAEISETEQAAQTPVVGNAPEFVEEAVEQPVIEPVEQPTEVVEREPVEVIEPEEIAAAVEEMTTDAADAAGELVGEAIESIEALMDEVASAVVIPERVDGGGGAPVVAEASPEATAQTPVVEATTQEAAVAGTVGVLTEREVVATRIKRAIDVDPRKPNAPIVGKGMEIKTVHPRYPTAVRLSALPKNPIVLIYFNGLGKVKKAEFLRDGVLVYSTGVKGVDGPLLNAIYQWRAKGAEIDRLDPADPDDVVEVSIKIVYRPERTIVPD